MELQPACNSPIEIRRSTLTETLKSRKLQMESKLDEINKALEALEKNPELQSLLDLVSKVQY